MPRYCAKEILNGRVRYLQPVGTKRNGKRCEFKKIALWIDMEDNLKRGVPQFLREAIKTMADFQRWLHGGGDVKAKILKLIEEREGSHV